MWKHRKSTESYQNEQLFTYVDYSKEYKFLYKILPSNCQRTQLLKWNNHDQIATFLVFVSALSSPIIQDQNLHIIYNGDTFVWYKWRHVSKGGTIF